jgi:putative transposase
VLISSVSRDRFADLAAALGTLILIDRWFQGEGFTRESEIELPERMMRRALVTAYESRIDWSYEPDNDGVFRVYARPIEEVGLDAFGKLLPVAVLLVKSLRRDGAQTDYFGVRPPLSGPGRLWVLPTLRARLEVLDGQQALERGADRGQAARDGEAPGAGHDDPAGVQAAGISDETFYRWRLRYGALKEDEAQRLKTLEQENSRLKKIVAEQALDISLLKDLQRGKW